MLKRWLSFALYLSLSWGVAYAADLKMQVGDGVGPIKLGMADSQLKTNPFGLKLSESGKDTEYEGQTVFYFFYGSKSKDNSYPLQVYSDVKGKIFIFEINSPNFVTEKGIRVGSTEAELLKAYGTSMKKQQRGKIYTKYSLGERKGTDFYVRQGKVTQILIRNY